MADIVQNGSFPLIQTDWTQTLPFQQFNPTQGTLNSVGLGIVGDVAGSFAIANHDSLATTVSGSLVGTENVFAGNAVAASTTDTAAIPSSALPNDQALTLWNLSADSAPALGTTNIGLGAFVGTGTIAVPVKAIAALHLTGSANEFFTSQASADAGVLLDYSYTPAAQGNNDGSVDDVFIYTGVPDRPDILPFPVGSIATPPQTFNLADRPTGWTDTIQVAPFDAALGTLEGVEIYLLTDLHTTTQIENVGSGDTDFRMQVDEQTTIGRPGSAVAPFVASATATSTGSLGSYDGAIDYAGSSGATVTASGTGSTASYDHGFIGDAADLAAFAAGPVTLALGNTDSSMFDGPGNVRVNLTSTSGAQVQVVYDYVPISQDNACFAAGTRIATETGAVAVEHLREGDRVRTHFAGTAVVRWIGHRRVDCARHPDPASVQPLRVRAHAFGPGLPSRDLLISRDHALFVDGHLIPARYLEDGDAIARVPLSAVTYFHVELDRHDVLFAEGLPAESYLETGQRSAFANGGAIVQAHPDFAARVREAEGCAPFAVTGPAVAAARARLGSDRQVMAVV
jgi:hypothetical protein